MNRKFANSCPTQLKAFWLFPALLAALLNTDSVAQDRLASNSRGDFGLGLVLGEPTGLSAKWWTSSQGQGAWDFGMAYSFNDFVLIWSDHLWHFPGGLVKLSKDFQTITPYVGLGSQLFISSTKKAARGGVHDGRDAGLGIRIPLGLEWIAQSAPLGVFLELVPGVDLSPAVDAFFQGGIGARFYF